MNGEIYFDMTRDAHRMFGRSKFLLRRWKKYDIFTKTGSYSRTENPSDNTYASMSVYLYDYVVVTDKWFFDNVATASYTSNVPSMDSDYAGVDSSGSLWNHYPNTWKNSPNATTNNYTLRSNGPASGFEGRPVYGVDPNYNPASLPPPYNFFTTEQFKKLMSTPIYRDDGTYFEIIRGYPRNHFTHKRNYFSLERYPSYGIENGVVTTQVYQRGRQTSATTIGLNGLGDGTDPVQSTQVSNVDIIQSDNVIYH